MIFLLLSFLSFFMRTLCNKEYTRHFTARETNLFFNAVNLSITCIISAVCGGFVLPSPLVLLLASLFGIIFVITVYLLLISYSKGPMGLVALIFGMSSIVPTTVGLTLFQEPLNLLKGLGLIAMIVVVILSWRDGEAKGSKSRYIPAKIWLPVTLLTTLINGALSTLQKMMVQWAPETSVMVFNFWGFLIGSTLCWIILLIHKARGGHFPEVTSKPKAFLVSAGLCGLGSSGGNILIMYALQQLPASIVNPVLSTMSTVSLYLVSIFYYKEGRTRYGYLMVAIGVLSIVLLGIS